MKNIFKEQQFLDQDDVLNAATHFLYSIEKNVLSKEISKLLVHCNIIMLFYVMVIMFIVQNIISINLCNC